MPSLTTQPEMMAVAAHTLAAIGSAMAVRNAVAAGPTLGVVPAAADPVSTSTAARFLGHALLYQQIAAQAAGVHAQLTAGAAASYPATDAATADG